MANLMGIVGKVMNFIPKTQGAKGALSLGPKQLAELAKNNAKAGRVINGLTKGVKNPTLDIAYKAQQNYSIAGIKLRDGRKVLGQGAVSVTNPGSRDAVIKYKATVDGGKTMSANGFIDGGKTTNPNDIAMGVSRRGGTVKADVELGENMAHHIAANEDAVVGLAKDLNLDDFLRNYAKSSKNIQKQLDRLMLETRKALPGNVPPAQFAKSAPETFAKVAEKTIPDKKIISKNFEELVYKNPKKIGDNFSKNTNFKKL